MLSIKRRVYPIAWRLAKWLLPSPPGVFLMEWCINYSLAVAKAEKAYNRARLAALINQASQQNNPVANMIRDAALLAMTTDAADDPSLGVYTVEPAKAPYWYYVNHSQRLMLDVGYKDDEPTPDFVKVEAVREAKTGLQRLSNADVWIGYEADSLPPEVWSYTKVPPTWSPIQPLDKATGPK